MLNATVECESKTRRVLVQLPSCRRMIFEVFSESFEGVNWLLILGRVPTLVRWGVGIRSCMHQLNRYVSFDRTENRLRWSMAWSIISVVSLLATAQVPGCNDPRADNYDPSTSLGRRDLCEYEGCNDSTATNFNSLATCAK